MIKQEALSLSETKYLLLGLIFVIPLFHNQIITGPLVNAILFLSVFVISLTDAMLLAVIPSMVALSFGLLPAIAAPLIPYIIVSNWVLLFIFNKYKDNFWLGVTFASLAKYFFLTAGSYILHGIAPAKIIIAMFSQMQLITALIGGFIAFILVKGLFKKVN